MRLSFFNIDKRETFTYKGDVKLYNELNNSKVIEKFNSVSGKITVERFEEVCVVRFKISFNLTVLSSLTNEPFTYKLKTDDVLAYTKSESYARAVKEDIILTSDNSIDLEETIYSLCITSLPIKLTKKGESYPQGENYRVMSEDEYLADKENEERGNAFDVLKDLDLGDEEEGTDK